MLSAADVDVFLQIIQDKFSQSPYDTVSIFVVSSKQTALIPCSLLQLFEQRYIERGCRPNLATSS